MSFTKLHHAVRQGDLQTCEELLTQGEDVNALDKHGNTPLMLALDTEAGHPLVAKKLVNSGAKVIYLFFLQY